MTPGSKGLTLDSLNVGIYGEIPSHWPDQSRNPRGAIPAKSPMPLGYLVVDKDALWSPMAAELYEEAVQRRWSPATDVPWDSLSPLPDDVERAICQLCTEFMHYSSVEMEVLTSWLPKLSYGYHEVKQFLATASLDAGRRYEAFRKRALYNGGGLGLESKGQINRFLLESTGGWSETAAGYSLIRGLFFLTTCEYLLQHSYNSAERTIYENVVQDVARLVSYCFDHLKYAFAANPLKKLSIEDMLTTGVIMLARDLKDPVLRESLAIVFAGGVSDAQKLGFPKYFDLVDEFRTRHLETRKWLGLSADVEQLPRTLSPRTYFKKLKK